MENFGGGGEILTIKFPACETGYTSYGCSMVSAGGCGIQLFSVYIVSWKINLYICHNILKNNDGRY